MTSPWTASVPAPPEIYDPKPGQHFANVFLTWHVFVLDRDGDSVIWTDALGGSTVPDSLQALHLSTAAMFAAELESEGVIRRLDVDASAGWLEFLVRRYAFELKAADK